MLLDASLHAIRRLCTAAAEAVQPDVCRVRVWGKINDHPRGTTRVNLGVLGTTSEVIVASNMFFAYVSKVPMLDFCFEGRDDSRGILGSIQPTGPAFAQADGLGATEELVRAHLGREPNDLVYIADANLLVYRIVTNEKHHQLCESAAKRVAIAWGIAALAIGSLLSTSTNALGVQVFFGATCLYLAMVWLRIFNAIEAAVICFIFLCLITLLARKYG